MIDDRIDVKLLRERLGWAQERMAAELGLHHSTVSRMENGQPPSGPTLILLRQLVQRADSLADAESSPAGEAETTGNGA